MGKGLAGGAALGDIIGGYPPGLFQLDDAVARDRGPLPRELPHKLIEAAAFLAAEQIVMRNEDVVEEEFGRVLRVHADLVEVAAAPKTLGLVGLDDEQRDALGARRRRVGLGDHDDDTAILAVADKGLLAVAHLHIVVEIGMEAGGGRMSQK